MKPIVNLEESPGKTVGRNTSRPGDYERLAKTSQAMMPRLPFPKGVFRFRTHEEADAWTDQHILTAALEKARAHQKKTT